MPLENTRTAYGSVTRILHWSTVLLFTFQFGSIVLFRTLASDPTDLTWAVLNRHKTSGLLILLIAALRLVWRRMSPLPNWPATFDAWDKRISHVAEYGLYAAMIVMSLSGLGIEITGGHYVPFFDVVHVDARTPLVHLGPGSLAPDVEAARAASVMPLTRNLLVAVHVMGAFATVALLFIHLSHVLRHAFGVRDGLFRRMISGSASGSPRA